MGILVGGDTKVVVQGITGKHGSFHARQMLGYGTRIVAGVNPRKGGSLFDGVPVFSSMEQAVARTGANASVVFIPAGRAVDSLYEAAEAGIGLIVCITEGIPLYDMVKFKGWLRGRGVRLIGPNCPGVITPGLCKVGIMPDYIHRPGRIGVVSRSGTLTYEVVNQLSALGLGQSTVVGIGGDAVIGSAFADILRLFEKDDQTDVIVMIGEIGGCAEEDAAAILREEISKPVVAHIAGSSAPPGKRMGHAGAIIYQGSGTAERKVRSLAEAGAKIVARCTDVGKTVAGLL